MNLTAAPVNYEWKLPFEARDVFGVDQVRAHLEPFEKKVISQLFLLLFSPSSFSSFYIKNKKIISPHFFNIKTHTHTYNSLFYI